MATETVEPEKRLPKIKSDPVAELPIYNFKYLTNTTEMHMANRGIDKIRGFEQFPCLEVLWLQDNQITSLNHLDENFRLKRLYVSGNKIQTLDNSSLRHLPSLEVLLLANNQITDLKVQLRQLRQLPCLQQLELLGNPVGEETHYRYQIINRCPNINCLDRHVITEVERIEAARLAQEYGWNKKPEPEIPEDIDMTLFKEGQNMKLKKFGIHLKESKLPRSWRKRPCFSRTYQPPHVKPVKYKSGASSQAELDLDDVNAAILAHRRQAAYALEKEMFSAIWWEKDGKRIGPDNMLKASFRADAASGFHDESTAQQQAFSDDLELTKKHMVFEHYPPWDPPKVKKKREPIGGPAMKKDKKIERKRVFTPIRGNTPGSEASGSATVGETIKLNTKLYETFERSKLAGKIQFGTGVYHL